MSDSLPMDCSPSGYTVPEILLARKLERVAIPFSRVSSRPRDWPWVSCIAGGFFTISVTREALKLPCLWYFVAAAWTKTTPCTHYCSVAKSCPTLWDSMDYIVHQASLSSTISWILLKLMSIELVMPSNHLILCCPHYQAPTTGLSYFLYVLSPLFWSKSDII